MASSLNLARATAGTWTAQGTNLSIDGPWDVDVVVQEAATAVDAPLRLRTRLPPEHITVSRAPGLPTLYTIQLGDGRSLQTYMEPGGPGPGNGVVHYTFFQSSEARRPSPPRELRRSHLEAPTGLEADPIRQRALRGEREAHAWAVDIPHRRHRRRQAARCPGTSPRPSGRDRPRALCAAVTADDEVRAAKAGKPPAAGAGASAAPGHHDPPQPGREDLTPMPSTILADGSGHTLPQNGVETLLLLGCLGLVWAAVRVRDVRLLGRPRIASRALGCWPLRPWCWRSSFPPCSGSRSLSVRPQRTQASRSFPRDPSRC